MRGWIHISFGGPIRKIVVNGKTILFEMHHYCGPLPVTKDGSELKTVPKRFWIEVSKWAQQGQQLHGDKCVYDSSVPLKDFSRSTSTRKSASDKARDGRNRRGRRGPETRNP